MSGLVVSRQVPTGLTVGRRKWAFAAICMANFMVLFDGTVVNLALPTLGREFGGVLTQLEWVANGYTIALAALILSGGIFGDRIGNERTLGLGLIGFTVTSLLAGLAPSLALLVVFRVLQGLAAALMLPAVLALLPHLYIEPRERARAVATWASVGGVAAASGPLLGGILVHTFGWRSVFVINVPIGVGTWLVARRTVPATPRATKARFDLPGQLLAVVAFGAACWVLVEGASLDWSRPWMWVPAAAAIGAAAGMIMVERHSRHPMVPPALFRSAGYTSSVVMVTLWQFVFFGELFVFSLLLQDFFHRGALRAGIEFLPMTVLTAVVPVLVTNRAVARFGRRTTLLTGIACGMAACVIVQFVGSYTMLALAMLGFGMFAGLTLPPIVAGGVAGVAPMLSGRASGVMNSSRQFGGVLGVALLGALTGVRADFTVGVHLGALLCLVLLVLMATLVVATVTHGRGTTNEQEG
ncbi:MFS transporter [Streptomyces sp. NPDC049687]|uniref:MFS transporter n=1 Tax=Streptomyces sp. NPDC049687 TaxID=3365596 RepID=UPI0037B4DAF3